jgi:hypothetical protein
LIHQQWHEPIRWADCLSSTLEGAGPVPSRRGSRTGLALLAVGGRCRDWPMLPCDRGLGAMLVRSTVCQVRRWRMAAHAGTHP